MTLAVLLATGLGSCDFSQTAPDDTLPSFSPQTPSVAPPVAAKPTSAATQAQGTTVPVRTATPPSAPHQLTTGGCCVRPFWGPDSASVYFLDRPPGDPLGIYRVDLEGSPPALVERGAAAFSQDMNWMAIQAGGAIAIVDRVSGDRWMVPSQGRMVRFSPDADWVTWQVQSSNVANLDRRRWSLWLGAPNSRDITSPLGGFGGGFIGWGPSESALLFTGRREIDGPVGLWRSSIDGDHVEMLIQAEGIRGSLVSPGGGWVALTVAFSGDQSLDGLWLVSTTGGQAFKLPQFGAYRWRREGQLLVIPLENGRTPIRLVQVDARDGRIAELTLADGAIPAISDNTWDVSPDGRWLVYQSGTDGNLWLLRLPGGTESP